MYEQNISIQYTYAIFYMKSRFERQAVNPPDCTPEDTAGSSTRGQPSGAESLDALKPIRQDLVAVVPREVPWMDSLHPLFVRVQRL